MSLQNGRRFEDVAPKKYSEVTGNRILDCGLVINSQQPYICSTPDGIAIDDDGKMIVLEIKAPSSCADANIDVPYLDENKDLVRSHCYFTQIQLQLFTCNLKLAHLFVWSSKDYKLVKVPRDDDFL